MSQDSLIGHRRLRLAVPLVGRDPDEEHRSATPLELFFDLVFVVAVALAADRFHHGLAEGAVGASLLGYVLVFFAIYWAWVNFTWFASGFDTDDLAYRLFVFVTIVGALIFAAGVPRAFEIDFSVAATGYAVMRVALVSQWLRVAFGGGPRRLAGRRFAAGLTVLQIGWLAALAVPPRWYVAAWAVLAVGELLLPPWGEAVSRTTWHPGHIAERYGLFMIIVLGESVLAATRAIQTVLDDGGLTGPIVPIIVGGLLILLSIWWTYFERPDDYPLAELRTAYRWSLLHLIVFSSVAAVGAGLVVAIEAASGHVELGPTGTAAATAVPFALYLLSMWGIHARAGDPPLRRLSVPVTAVLVLAATFTGAPVLLMGLAAAGLVTLKTAARLRDQPT